MVARVPAMAVRRFVTVVVDLLDLGATMVPGAQVGSDRGVAAERQHRGDQQHDQDSGKASHAENPITDAFSQTRTMRRSSPQWPAWQCNACMTA